MANSVDEVMETSAGILLSGKQNWCGCAIKAARLLPNKWKR